MASTFRIPKATITGLYGKALTTYARRTWGQVPDNAYVLWHNRKVMKAVFSFEQKVAKFDALDRDLSVLAQAATAATVGCSWCLDFGYYLAHSEGMDLEKIREVMRWRESDAFSPVEREVLGYAEAMSTTPLTVTDEMVASLLGHLGEEAMVELTMMVAIENERARFNSAAGLQAQGFSDVCEVPMPSLSSLHAVPSGMNATARGGPTPSSRTGTCSSRSPTRCSARPRTPRTCSRRPGCAGPRSTTTRSATNAPTWCGSPPASRSTGCAPWPGSARPTSGRGCPSRCSPRPTSPRTSSSPTASRPRCSSCSRP